jgi:xanthosine utilization system XapX-like protein
VKPQSVWRDVKANGGCTQLRAKSPAHPALALLLLDATVLYEQAISSFQRNLSSSVIIVAVANVNLSRTEVLLRTR